jgi:hypothetical protein
MPSVGNPSITQNSNEQCVCGALNRTNLEQLLENVGKHHN